MNKFSFELHLPGYNYTGYGIHFLLNLEKRIEPKNKVYEESMYRDNYILL